MSLPARTSRPREAERPLGSICLGDALCGSSMWRRSRSRGAESEATGGARGGILGVQG
jgi:hypothetical protein